MRSQKLVVATLWMAAVCFGAEPSLAVVIYDRAGTPGAILEVAAKTAYEAFRITGVKTSWSVCRVSRDLNEECVLPPFGAIFVHVLPTGLEHGLQTREDLGGAIVCPRCVTSYAFYQPVKTLAESVKRSVSAALALVMVHEVGHLLGMGHTPSGIMKARLTWRDIKDAEMGRMRFTEGKAKLLAAAAERETFLLAPGQ